MTRLNNERVQILDKIGGYDDWSNEGHVKERIEQLKWLKDYINLERMKNDYVRHKVITHRWDIPGKVNTTLLTYRQISSIERVFKNTNNNNFPEAYHALTEFIDNYQYTIEEPLNDYEKLMINMAIDQMIHQFGM